MADDPANAPPRTSFAFARRADLPDHGDGAWRDAGKASRAFDPAQAGPLPAQTPVNANDNAAAGADERLRLDAFVLPDPRPSFARPARPSHDEEAGMRARAPQPAPDRSGQQAFFEKRQADADRAMSCATSKNRER